MSYSESQEGSTLHSDSQEGSTLPLQCNELSEHMSVEELSVWLKGNEIPDSFCQIIADNYIDGKEFMNLSEQEVKDIIPAIGIVKKIMRLIQKNNTVESSPPILAFQSPSQVSNDTLSVASSESSHGSGNLSGNNFMIPSHWRPEVLNCIENKELTPESRNFITRTLVTLAMTRVGPKITRNHCELVSRKLILKYPFMKDDIGNGYSSWVDKMLERVRNVGKNVAKAEKKRKGSPEEEQSAPKRAKVDKLMRRYPVIVSSEVVDEATMEQHIKAIKEEMEKSKPRDRILLPLMKATFQNRLLYVRNDANSVKEIIEKYPCFKYPSVIEQEMAMISEKTNVKLSFVQQWAKFVPAIIEYGEKSPKKSIRLILADLDDTDDFSRGIVALKILCEFLTPRNVKNAIEYILTQYQASVPVCEAAHSNKPAPRIGVYDNQLFIFVEDTVLCTTNNFADAVFLMFSSYYTFYVEYPTPVKAVFWFMQDYIYTVTQTQVTVVPHIWPPHQT